MSSQEKAHELVSRFYPHSFSEFDGSLVAAKKCAIICVDEILEFEHNSFELETEATKYWQSVKTEIQNL